MHDRFDYPKLPAAMCIFLVVQAIEDQIAISEARWRAARVLTPTRDNSRRKVPGGTWDEPLFTSTASGPRTGC